VIRVRVGRHREVEACHAETLQKTDHLLACLWGAGIDEHNLPGWGDDEKAVALADVDGVNGKLLSNRGRFRRGPAGPGGPMGASLRIEIRARPDQQEEAQDCADEMSSSGHGRFTRKENPLSTIAPRGSAPQSRKTYLLTTLLA